MQSEPLEIASPASAALPRTESVAAVVVTRDRLTLLQRCLEALQRQTRPLDAIYVVDVASSDGTPEFLAGIGAVKVVRLETNAGGAGGFHAGISAAHADGYDWVWCMDDDGYPADDALQQIMEAAPGGNAKWLNSLVLNVDDAELLAFPFPRPDDCNIIHAEEVRALGAIVEDCCPFNGTLIHRDIVEKVGTPHPDFFIWGDEQEYKRRATNGGFRVLTITDSTFYHPASSGIPLPIMPLKSFWKQYYHVRNHGATATKEGDLRLSPRGAVKLANVFTIYLLKNMVSNIIKIMMIWAAVLAALFNHRRRHFK